MPRPTVNKGWEARLEDILDRMDITVNIDINSRIALESGLTEDELIRIRPKLRLVEDFAIHMADNMLKGTIKYPTDTYDVSVWMAEEEDDTVDSVNYRLLRRKAMEDAGWI